MFNWIGYDVLARRTASSITLATNVGGTTTQTFQYDGLGRTTFTRDSVSSTNADASFAFDSLGRVVEEVQTYNSNTRYVTHDKFTGITATGLMYANNRQVASGYDSLYRRNTITKTSGGANIATTDASVAVTNSTTSYIYHGQ